MGPSVSFPLLPPDRHRRPTPIGGSAATLLPVLALLAAVALPGSASGSSRTASACTPVFVTAWGSPGAGNGQLSGPVGVAVDSSGNVYVADSENDRIQEFTGSGAFVNALGSS